MISRIHPMSSSCSHRTHSITELLLFIIGTELVGALSALVTGNAFRFYQTYTKPPFSPPGWVFPVTWAILYAFMGISVYLIFMSSASGQEKRKAYLAYGVQLAINFLWSVVFFKWQMLGLSVLVILALLVSIIIMMLQFYRIRPVSMYWNIPYLLWTAFAAYLNIGIFLLQH